MMQRKWALVLLVFATVLGTRAWASQIDPASTAYQRGDYATALRLFQVLAERGDVGAQFHLGFMHAKGEGTKVDFAEALTWYRRAAERGHTVAQHNLALAYHTGEGTSQDFAEAAKWYQQAAEHGYVGAWFNLGYLYANGQGVPQDYIEAIKWFGRVTTEAPPSENTLRVEAAKHRDLLLANLKPEHTGPLMVLRGPGAEACSAWLQSREETQRGHNVPATSTGLNYLMRAHWIAGMLVARNLTLPNDRGTTPALTGDATTDELLTRLDAYCTAHPLDDLQAAVKVLGSELEAK